MSCLRFLTADDPDMARVRAIRRRVFVQDLGVPEQQEFDRADLPGEDTVYALLTADGAALGTGRLQGPAHEYKIGRIAFLPSARGRGSGRCLVTALVRRAAQQGAWRVPVDARLEAVGFYEKLGFVPCGQPFMQRGMRHLPMELTGAALRRLVGENDHDEEEK